MKIKNLVSLLAIVTTLSAYGQSAKVPISSTKTPEVHEADIWHWADEPWSDNDRPYRQVRIGIDAAVTSKQNLLVLEQV